MRESIAGEEPGRWALVPVVLLLLSPAAGPGQAEGPPPPPETLTVVEMAQHSAESVVVIQVKPRVRGPLRQASGFVVDPAGAIATCLHVLDGAESIVVKVGRKKFSQVVVAGFDAEKDVALLRIEAEDLPALPLGDSSLLEVGDPIVAIGNPLGLTRTVTEGVFSAVREPAAEEVDEGEEGEEELRASPRVRGGLPRFRLLQISAQISPGSSGGPVLERHGTVIGVAMSGVERGTLDLNFAIPVEALKPLLEQDRGLDLGSFQERADQERSDLAEPHLAEARLALVLGRTEEAERELERALALHPRSVEALLLQAKLLEGHGEIDEAEKFVRRATEADPESAEVWFEFGRFHLGSGLEEATVRRGDFLLEGVGLKRDLAMKAFRKALEIDDEHAGAAYGIGTILYVEGRYREAITMLSHAAAADPDLLLAGLRLGESYLVLERLAEAQTAYETVLGRDEDYALAHHGMARVFESKLDLMTARQHWRRFLELSEGDPSLEALRGRTVLYLERFRPEALPERDLVHDQ